jgi:hypothetical protein
MISHEIPKALVDWTENMLVERNLTIIRKESLMAHQIEAVCREGFYPHYCGASGNDLLEDLQREGYHVYGYADDSHCSWWTLSDNSLRLDGACPEDDIQMVQDQRSGGQSKDQCNDLHHVTQT